MVGQRSSLTKSKMHEFNQIVSGQMRDKRDVMKEIVYDYPEIRKTIQLEEDGTSFEPSSIAGVLPTINLNLSKTFSRKSKMLNSGVTSPEPAKPRETNLETSNVYQPSPWVMEKSREKSKRRRTEI